MTRRESEFKMWPGFRVASAAVKFNCAFNIQHSVIQLCSVVVVKYIGTLQWKEVKPPSVPVNIHYYVPFLSVSSFLALLCANEYVGVIYTDSIDA